MSGSKEESFEELPGHIKNDNSNLFILWEKIAGVVFAATDDGLNEWRKQSFPP